MSRRRRSDSGHQVRSLVAAVVVSLATFVATAAVPYPSGSSPPSPAPPEEPAHPIAADVAAGGFLARNAIPARVRIPAIGVDASVGNLGLDGRGTLDVPEDFGRAGWYEHGARPGEPGPAVVVGHVDSHEGPAVFHRLGDLDEGDAVAVEYGDGTEVRFRVYHRAQYAKDRFPTATVYANTPGPELRLITCGGTFDRSAGHYRDNVVVWATADGTGAGPQPEL